MGQIIFCQMTDSLPILFFGKWIGDKVHLCMYMSTKVDVFIF